MQNNGLDFFSGGGETLPPVTGLLLPLFLSLSESWESIVEIVSPKLVLLALDRPTLGILPKLWEGGASGDIRPSLAGDVDGESSVSRALFRLPDSFFSDFTLFSFSSFPLELLLLDLELLLLLEMWPLDLELLELELDFLESDLWDDFLVGLFSFLSLDLDVSSRMIGGAGATTSFLSDSSAMTFL